MTALTPQVAFEHEFLVVCFCAAWCGTCREYEPGFGSLRVQFPNVSFVWVDIEDEHSGVEDWEIENFPTLLIQRNELVLFIGPMLPYQGVLKKALDTYLEQSGEEAYRHAYGTPERIKWQKAYNYRAIMKGLI